MQTKTTWILAFLTTACLGLASGCGPRQHLREDYGAASRNFTSRQRVYPKAATGGPRGLDSEEAALVHGTYRRGLAGEGKSAAPEPGAKVLLIEDSDGAKNKR